MSFIFLPKISLIPNQATFYNEVYRVKNYDDFFETRTAREWSVRARAEAKRKRGATIHSNFSNRHHSFTISSNAYRNLRKKMNWLYFLSKPRYIKTYSGREIFGFKMAFITLTLSSKQKHPTSFLNSELLNQFLTEIRQRTGMKNYLWRLEFQENGNAHWHIATDTYLDYFLVKKIWNRIQQAHGYIDDYKSKHVGMKLSDYVSNYASDRVSYSDLAKRYAKGCQDNWENPPSVDVKSVVNGKSIIFYISKYFSKNDEAKTVKNDLDNEENSRGLRLWFTSRSLSALKSVSGFLDEFHLDLRELFLSAKKAKTVILKYSTVVFFDVKEMTTFFRKMIDPLLRDYSRRQGYIPSS